MQPGFLILKQATKIQYLSSFLKTNIFNVIQNVRLHMDNVFLSLQCAMEGSLGVKGDNTT